MNKLPLSVALIAFNEENRIGKTLEAIKDIASEIIVVDAGSKDRTVEIARDHGAKVSIEVWKGYRDQKNSALAKCSQEWIFFLDCDEVVSEELRKSIMSAITNPTSEGYFIHRKTIYLGKLLNHVWQPDLKLRLVNRKSSPTWKGGSVHEYLAINDKTSRLEGYLYHYSYRDINHHFLKMINYTKLHAEDAYKAGKSFKSYKIVLSPLASFTKEFFIKKGFLDGVRGFIVAFSGAIHTFLKYAFLFERHIKGKCRNEDIGSKY